MFTGEDALRMAEAHADKGFEAWRQLKARYAPEGGRMELHRLQSFFAYN